MLSRDELEQDLAEFEKLINQHRQLLADQISGIRIESACATQIAILRFEGAWTYIHNNLERIDDKERLERQAKSEEAARKHPTPKS